MHISWTLRHQSGCPVFGDRDACKEGSGDVELCGLGSVSLWILGLPGLIVKSSLKGWVLMLEQVSSESECGLCCPLLLDRGNAPSGKDEWLSSYLMQLWISYHCSKRNFCKLPGNLKVSSMAFCILQVYNPNLNP